MKNLIDAILAYARAVAIAEKAITGKQGSVAIDVAMLNLEFARKQLKGHGINLAAGVPQ